MYNNFMSFIICCASFTRVHRSTCLSLAWEKMDLFGYFFTKFSETTTLSSDALFNVFHAIRLCYWLTSFAKNMLSLIFFLLISIAREEHEETVDLVLLFRLKFWISRDGSILASSLRQAPPRSTNRRITQSGIDQSRPRKALRCLHNSGAVPFLNSERLECRHGVIILGT